MPSSLPDDVAKRLRDAVENRVLPVFSAEGKDKAQSSAARAITQKTGISVLPSTLSRLVRRRSSGSFELVRAVAMFLGEDPDVILHGPSKKPVAKRLRDLPGFADAHAEAQRRVKQEHPGIEISALNLAGEATVTPPPEQVSAGLLIQLALSLGTGMSKVATLKR